MSRIYLNEFSSGKIKNAKIKKFIEKEEYKNICEDITEKIIEKQKERAKTYIKAKNFIAR